MGPGQLSPAFPTRCDPCKQLQIMLQEEGVYAYKCQIKFPCEEQAVQLQMMYTLATSAFCFCVWPTGLVRGDSHLVMLTWPLRFSTLSVLESAA